MNKLAILGGNPEIEEELEPYNSISDEETSAVVDVMHSGTLSGFVGEWCDEFYGGKKVRELEESWAEKFDRKFAVSINSNTSGLIAALGAIGLCPGDEVIVPPYTMSATAIAPLYPVSPSWTE